MLTGAIIGAIAGLVVYLIQTQKKKKEEQVNQTLDKDL